MSLYIKLGDKYSDWLGLSKGFPQGSIMGPFIFNIFSNECIRNMIEILIEIL